MNQIKAFGDTLFEGAKKHKNSVVLTSDFVREAGVNGFTETYGERFFNMGLSEANTISCAAGFAVRGKMPVIAGYTSAVVEKAWSEIRNNICLPNLNVKIVGVGNGLSCSHDGPIRQAFEDIGLMRILPNMKIICPADERETEGAVNVMMKEYGPCYLRLSFEELPVVCDRGYEFAFGKSLIVREGKDVCIFALGPMVYRAKEIAEDLFVDGISVKVVNMSSVKPLDENTVRECARESKICAIMEDHSVIGGLCSAISDILAEENDVKLLKFAFPDKFGESGKQEDLYKKFGFDKENIIDRIKAVI